jgi:hypothetical protein
MSGGRRSAITCPRHAPVYIISEKDGDRRERTRGGTRARCRGGCRARLDCSQGNRPGVLRYALRVRATSDDIAQNTESSGSFPAKGSVDDQSVFYSTAGGLGMLTIDATATLAPARKLGDDQLTELIATVVDYLDTRVIEPSVSTIRSNSDIRVEISVSVDTDDPWKAQALAAAVLRDAFGAAVPAIAGITHGIVLQAA